MGSLIKYSGITAKIRAMERWCLSETQFSELAAAGSVPAAVDYLKKMKPYEELFRGMEEKDLHRANIERKLGQYQFDEFTRLYQFADQQQKHFLDLYFMHYEILIIKRCLRNAVGHTNDGMNLSSLQDFFSRHTRLDLITLSASDSLETFVKNLEGSQFYQPLQNLMQEGCTSMAVYESTLDMIYFKTMWQIKDKYLSKEEAKIIAESYGTRLDMLNIQWIWRSRNFYQLPAQEVKSMLIPYGYHLRKEDLEQLAQVESVEALRDAVNKTWYGRLSFTDENGELEFEEKVDAIVDRIYRVSRRNDPNSIAVLNSHLYFKEKEINRIITTIEKIRYGMAG